MGSGNQLNTKAATVAAPLAGWQKTPLRSFLLLDPSLDSYTLSGRERVVIGRASDCTWQIKSKYVSRHHVEISVFNGNGIAKRHMDAHVDVRINGANIGTRAFSLEPWTFIELGDKTILIEGDPAKRPTVIFRIAGLNNEELAIRYLAVYGSLRAVSRATKWSRLTTRRRLEKTETGRALLTRNSEQNDVRLARATVERSDGVPRRIPD